MYDYVIVGAGLAGCVIANLLAKKGNKILVLEKRNHIGGNIYDEIDKETGLIVQKYGPHIFHTNDEGVYSYITSIAQWIDFKVSCGADINGICTPSPFNFKTIDQFYDSRDAKLLKDELIKEYKGCETVTIVELLNSNNPIIKQYAKFLFEEDYSLYTAKQWGINPSQVDINVLKRVPVRLDYKEQYFTDKYQMMPKNGFTDFAHRLIDNPNIKVMLNIDALERISFMNGLVNVNFEGCKDSKIIWTGPIDSLFDYSYGLLPYRSLEFKYERISSSPYQSYPVVAYPKANGYTRITDYSLLPKQDCFKTIIAKEYPIQYTLDSKTDPYYPINNEQNLDLYKKYYEESKKFKNLYLVGRLAMYKYYNMDQVIRTAIDIAKEL